MRAKYRYEPRSGGGIHLFQWNPKKNDYSYVQAFGSKSSLIRWMEIQEKKAVGFGGLGARRIVKPVSKESRSIDSFEAKVQTLIQNAPGRIKGFQRDTNLSLMRSKRPEHLKFFTEEFFEDLVARAKIVWKSKKEEKGAYSRFKTFIKQVYKSELDKIRV